MVEGDDESVSGGKQGAEESGVQGKGGDCGEEVSVRVRGGKRISAPPGVLQTRNLPIWRLCARSMV